MGVTGRLVVDGTVQAFPNIAVTSATQVDIRQITIAELLMPDRVRREEKAEQIVLALLGPERLR
jgi:hypothetical protein